MFPALKVIVHNHFYSPLKVAWLGFLLLLPPDVVPAELVNSFQAGEGGWHLGTLAIGNVDNDPDLEIIVPYRTSVGTWVLDGYDYNGQRLAGFPHTPDLPLPGLPRLSADQQMNVSATLFDLTGNGREEILFSQGSQVVAMKGDGSILWASSVTADSYVPDAGYQTVTNGFYWSATGDFISHLPSTASFSSPVSPPVVADLNRDGRLEVITAWKIDPDTTSDAQDFNPFINDIWGFAEWGTVGEVWSGGIVIFDAEDGSEEFVYHFHQLVESGLAVGQADSDLALEVYVLNDSDSVVAFDWTRPFGLHGNGMLQGQFGKNQRLMSGSYLVGVDVQTADLDGDGKDEVLVPTTHRSPLWQPSETVLDDNGTILWRRWNSPVDFSNLHGWLNSAVMIPVNPDHDNHMDVLTFAHSHTVSFRYWDGINLVDHPGWPKDFFPRLPTPPVVGDVDGDNHEEIVIGTYHPGLVPSNGDLRVYNLEGELESSIPVPGGLKHVPTIADVDRDGRVEVVYRSLLGRISIVSFATNQTGNVSWSTHRGNHRRDGRFSSDLFPPGTPLVANKESSYRRNRLAWVFPPGYEPVYTRLYRAQQPNGPFHHLTTLSPNQKQYVDDTVNNGSPYFYEIRADYGTNEVASAPVMLTPLANNNLVANGAFEENHNSNWDKWFTGNIHWSEMIGTSEVVHAGHQSMGIILQNKGNNSSIGQYGQYGTPDAYLPVIPGQWYSFGGQFKSGGLTGSSKHWIEWNSARTGENPNTRPTLPWPNYFTPHFILSTNATPWTYANRVFRLPPGFPNVEIRHRFTTTKPISGTIFLDDFFFRRIPPPTASSWETLNPWGAVWRYETASPPPDWHKAEFNDSSWPLGQAKFGAGGGPANIVTRLPPRKPAYYFRRHFTVPKAAFSELLLGAKATDDYGGRIYPLEIYLNGFAPRTTGIETVTGTGNAARYYDLSPFLDLLHPGTNTLAVIVRNTWESSWDNVAFDLTLKALPYQPVSPKFTAIQPDSPGIRVQLAAHPGSVWDLQTTDSLGHGSSWKTVKSFTIPADARHTVLLEAPTLPNQQQFYRLTPF